MVCGTSRFGRGIFAYKEECKKSKNSPEKRRKAQKGFPPFFVFLIAENFKERNIGERSKKILLKNNKKILTIIKRLVMI